MMNVLLAALWRASWQGALAILVVGGVCRIAERRLSPALRCALWRLTYAKLLIGLAVAGGVALPLLRPATQQAAMAAPSVATLAEAMPPSSPVAQASSPVAAPLVAAPIPVAARPAAKGTLLSWQSAIVAAYVAGLLVCLTRLARALWRTRTLLCAATPIDENNEHGDAAKIAALSALAASMGLRRVPRLAISAILTSPAYVAGTVLLPSRADYTPGDLRLILAHELAHAHRHDLAWEWLGVAAQTLFFFHPLVYLARREERLARESAADALALAVTDAPAAALGRLLLDLARRSPSTPPLAAAIGVAEGGSLLRRRLLALKQAPPTPLRRAIALVAVVTLLTLVPWRLIRANGQQHHVAPNTDIIRHSAKFPDIPHGTHRLVGQVRDDAGRPAQDVLVGITLVSATPSFEPLPYPQPMRMVYADATGNYAIADLPEGHYLITATDGRAFATLSTDPAKRHRLSAVGRFTPTFSRTTIGREAKASALNLTISRGVTLTGRVLDEHGQPLINIRVTGGCINSDGSTGGLDGAFTDTQGRYLLRLPPGRVFAQLAGTGTRWDATIEKTFPLSLGQSATYDFHIAPSDYLSHPPRSKSATAVHANQKTPSLFAHDLPPGDRTITGTVRDDQGNPADNVAVTALFLPKGQGLYSEAHGELSARTVYTNALGKYDFAGVAAGRYGLMTCAQSAADGTPLPPHPAVRQQFAAVWRFVPTAVETAVSSDEKTKFIDLTATRGVTLSGRVLNKASGQPLPGIRVLSERKEANGSSELGVDTAVTDSQGRYLLRVLPGRVSARLEFRGKTPSEISGQAFDLARGQNAAYDFHIAPPSAPNAPEHSTAPQPAPVSSAPQKSSSSPPRGDKSIVGVVRSGETGKPVANMVVRVETEARGADGKPFAAFATRSDAAGGFAVTQIPAGRYRVSVDLYTTATVELNSSDTTKKVSLSYIRPATVSGKITNRATGKPESVVTISAASTDHPSGTTYSATIFAGADGHYGMELKAGDVFITPYSGAILYDSRHKKMYVSDESKGKKLHLAPGQKVTLDFAVDESKGVDKRTRPDGT